jgi:hypothetical protein
LFIYYKKKSLATLKDKTNQPHNKTIMYSIQKFKANKK